MKEAFIDRNFRADTLDVIDSANKIISEYRAHGFVLTLRQLYYQFVSRALIPNTQQDYKRMGSIVNDGRLAGLIDWDAIEDRTRNVRSLSTWSDPSEIIGAVAHQYREDLWAKQPRRPEVWIEKDALIGVIEGVCDGWRVDYFACRGYTSQSEQYRAGKRFKALLATGVTPWVFHLGDHDPSGIDMTRDNVDRLQMFARSLGIRVVRLALNRNQVDQYNPPPNPTKDTDSRSTGYRDEHGEDCWELDALDPTVIADLVRSAIDGIVDHERWDIDVAAEQQRKRILEATSERWDEVHAFLEEDQ